MKTLIIIVLILLVLGLYFVPDFTKKIMKTTTDKVLDISKERINKIEEGMDSNLTNISNKNISTKLNVSNNQTKG